MDNQDKNINEIRDLLKKKLADHRPADNGWNVPSGSVWDGLSEDLQAEVKIDKSIWQRYLFMALAVILLSILLLQECSHRHQVTELKSEMQNLKSSVTDLQQASLSNSTDQEKNNLHNKESETTRKTTGENTASNFSQSKPSTFSGIPSASEISILKSQSIAGANAPESVADLTMDNNPNEHFILHADINRANGTYVNHVSKAPEKITGSISGESDELSRIPLLSLYELPHVGTYPILDLSIPTLNNSKSALIMTGSIHAGISLTGNHLTGEQPGIIADQKSLLAYRTGFGVEANLNRNWSVVTGLHYTTSNVETVYQLEVPFTNNGEFQHDDGNYDNEYNHSLPSSYGNYPAQLVLTRESTATVEEGELMNLDLTIRQRMRFLSLPISLRYGFGKNSSIPVQFGVSGGIVANYTLGISSEASSLVSHHGAIHQRHTSIGTPVYDDLQKTTLDYSIGLDVRYFLTPRMSVSLETSYQRGITPIYKDELVKNYLKALNAGIGLRMAF